MSFPKTAALLLAGLLLESAPLFAQIHESVAGSVVQSQEWTVRRGAHESEEFSGDVRYNAGQDSVGADWALYDHAAKSWSLKGHVDALRVLSSGDKVAAQGDEAFDDGVSSKGWLIGKDGVFISRQPAQVGDPDRAHAQRLDWQGQNEAVLTGDVHSFGPRLETWSDKAQYLASAQETILSGGRPVARKIFGQWTGAVKADQIQAFDSPRRLVADGGVVGWIVLPKTAKAKKSK